MSAAARLGDSCAGHGCFPATPIMAGSGNVSINGKPAARQGDSVMLHGCPCPKKPHGIHGRSISAGSATVSINGKPAARVGDAVGCGGSICAGSGNVIIGDSPYQSPVAKCAGGAVASRAPFLKISPLAEPTPSDWSKVIFTPEYYEKAMKKLAVQADIAMLDHVLLTELTPLAQRLIASVRNGADKQGVLDILEVGTTKVERRTARKEIATKAAGRAPDVAKRFRMDMDAAEKAMLSDHIYTLDKPIEKLDPRRQQLVKDFDDDSGWQLATPTQVKSIGLTQEDLTIASSNFRSQVYIPDKAVFGSDAKPVVVFRGTEMSKMDDWRNNLQQGINNESQYYRRAVQIGRRIRKSGKQVEIAGHSLGGGMGSAAAKASNMPAITYNAVGLHPKTVERYGIPLELQGGDSLIKGYRIDGEILTYVQEDHSLLKHTMPKAIRDSALNTTLPQTKSLTPHAIGIGIAAGIIMTSPVAAAAGYGGTKAKEKVDLHGMDQMRVAIEERKVNDLHYLTATADAWRRR